MKCGHFMLLLVFMVYIDLYKPALYVNGKIGDNCSGNDTSTCGGTPTQYVCKNNLCRCNRNLYYIDDEGNCVQFKDAVPVSNVEIVNQTVSNFTVTWSKPAEYPGPMFYNIYIYETERRDSELADETLHEGHITDNVYETTEYFYSNGVVGDWGYRAAVKVYLLNEEVDSSNETYSQQIRTPTAPSNKVQSFRIIVLGFNHSKAEVRWTCPNEKQRNGVLTNYTLEMKMNGSEETTFYTIPIDDYEDQYDCMHKKKIEIKPGSVYTFTIRANNKDYLGKEHVEQYIAEEATPNLPLGHEAIFKYDPVSTTETTVTFQYCSKCLLDDSNGAITYSAILICHYKYCKDQRLETIDEQVIRKFTTWKQAKEAGFNSPFLVTKGDWIKVSNDSDFVTFTAGNEEGCDEKSPTTVCNGPLESDTAYQAIAFTCTRVGCSNSYLGGQGWYRTQAKDNTIAIVLGVLGALLGIVIIVTVVLLYQKGMLPCSSKHKPYSVPQVEQVKM